MKKTMRLWIQPRATRSAAAVVKPPMPSAAPSSRDFRTCFFIVVLASCSGVCPGPATCTQWAAWGAKRSAAARAMCSGACWGSSRMRRQSDSGTLGASSASTTRSLAAAALRYLYGMATPTTTPHRGILSPEMSAERDQLIEMLTRAYWMEIETVMSYLANSINPDGVRAQEIKESLEEDIQEELGHAKLFAERIKELYGVVPGSLEFSAEQSYLQPPEH